MKLDESNHPFDKYPNAVAFLIAAALVASFAAIVF